VAAAARAPPRRLLEPRQGVRRAARIIYRRSLPVCVAGAVQPLSTHSIVSHLRLAELPRMQSETQRRQRAIRQSAGLNNFNNIPSLPVVAPHACGALRGPPASPCRR
jgi:hypothetical protein